ncbi:unnamed protein product [Mytilus coruscus]|uniref:CCHC-type domain-containing protein n=1 Tax=Mytilus coruscus TaxID=42192 RepID=A0A6J8EQT7_MYTCO|nr:unnamed protein product [Mytilus coruscus]
MFSNKKTAKPGKTPDNYKQQIHNKLDSALEGLDIDIFTNHHDDSVIFQKKSQTPDDCDNDTTIPYVDDQSSPIHSQFNPFVTPWAKPTLPTSIRPLRLSFVQKLVIPLSKKPAPVAVNPLLKTPQQLASLYPKLPTSTLATASIATTATSAPTVTSTTSTVVSSAIVPVTTTAATAGATATTIPGTISTTTSTSSSDEIHSLRKHIQSINVNSTIPVTTQNQSYQPSQQPEYLQQPVYYTPRAPNHTMYPSNRKSQTPDDCDNDTTIPYVDDQSSPIHSQFNPFVTPWAKPTLPTSIRPLRLSFVQKLVIPLSKKPAPVAVNPLLKTPQQLASLYPKLPTSTLATASIATTATSAPTVTSTTSTVVSSAIVPVTTTAATAGATATTIPGTISTTTSTSSSDEIHSLRKHIQSINVNSTIPVTTQNQSYQPSQQPEYLQQPVYYTPRAPNHTMYPSNRYKAPQNQQPRQNFNRMHPRQPANQNIRQPIRYQNQSQTAFRRCLYCNGFSHNKAQCPANGVICHLCNKMGHFSKACLSTRRMQTQ